MRWGRDLHQGRWPYRPVLHEPLKKADRFGSAPARASESAERQETLGTLVAATSKSGQVWVRTLARRRMRKTPGNRGESRGLLQRRSKQRTGLGPHSPTVQKVETARKLRKSKPLCQEFWSQVPPERVAGPRSPLWLASKRRGSRSGARPGCLSPKPGELGHYTPTTR